MGIIFSIIFILSLAAGAAFGYYHHYTWVQYIISFAISGFIGSSIIALLFSYLYLFQKDADTPEPQNLHPNPNQDEITHLNEGIKKIGQ